MSIGNYHGASLVQQSGKLGGSRSVFVAIPGLNNDTVFPTFGGVIMNPPKGRAKMFAGDLAEFRTDEKGQNPKYYILRTFKVVADSTNSKTVYFERTQYSHVPFAGDTIIVAPEEIGGTGTKMTVSAVAKATLSNAPVWKVTLAAAASLTANDILVECDEAGTMLVKNINSVFHTDSDFMYDSNVGEIEPSYDSDGNITNIDELDFEKARYQATLALGGVMYTHRMSPMPKCVLDLNRSKVNGWFKINWYD